MKAISVVITDDQIKHIKEQSFKMFGKPNVSAYIKYLIEKDRKQ